MNPVAILLIGLAIRGGLMSRRPNHPSQAFVTEVQHGLVAAGLSADFFSWDEIGWYWRGLKSVEDVVAAARCFAKRVGVTTREGL